MIALDVLRAAQANPESVEALADEIALGAGFDPRIEAAADLGHRICFATSRRPRRRPAWSPNASRSPGRRVCWRGSAARRWPKPFVRSRLRADGGRIYGTLPADCGPAARSSNPPSPDSRRLMPLKVVVIGGGIAGVSAAYHLASVRCRGDRCSNRKRLSHSIRPAARPPSTSRTTEPKPTGR